MALLIVNLDKFIGNAQAWRDPFAAQMPGLEVRIWPDNSDPKDIEYLAFMRPDFDILPAFPNLKAMFTRGAGVEQFVNHPNLPKAPMTKLESLTGDPMMTEYVIMHVLRLHRELPTYHERQKRKEWYIGPVARPEDRRIGFLGYGMMAKAPAQFLKQLEFPVSTWTKTPKADDGIRHFHGDDQLEPFLRQTDIAVCLLPLTAETEGIFNARNLAMMPKGSMVVNIGRGGHVVQDDLIAALDSGHIAHASLDALKPEPLPADNPLWSHPKVTIMPHVARRPTVKHLTTQIVANIKSLQAGKGLLQPIDKQAGY